jgi:hypothetical protein
MTTEKINRPVFQCGSVSIVQLRKNADINFHQLTRSNIKMISLIEENNLLEKAPFTWFNFIYRYGEHNKFEKPEIGRISKKYGDLPVTVEIASDWIEYASFNDEAMLEQIFESTALMALIHVGKKYKLPIEGLEARLKEIGGFPELPEDYYEKLPTNPHRVPKEQLPQFKN